MMKQKRIDGRVLLFALLATLLLRLLALGAEVEVSATSSLVTNQTIPTRTPTGQAPPTQPPAGPPTNPPPGPTSTPVTPVPSATRGGPTATRTPTPLPATATALASRSPVPSATPSTTRLSLTSTPAGAEGTGTPPPTASLTPAPGETLSAPTAATPGETLSASTAAAPGETRAESPASQGTPGGEGAPATPTSAPRSEARGLVPWDVSCLWGLGGLALMAVGLVILLRHRRA